MNISAGDILKRYQELQPKKGSRLTPRIGYYFITEIHQHRVNTEFYFAKAIWKEKAQYNFNEEAIVEVGIAGFQFSASKWNEASFFLNKQIHVISQELTTTTYKGEVAPFVKSEWVIIPGNPVMEQLRPSFLDLLKTNSLEDLLAQTPEPGFNGGDDDDYFGDEIYDDIKP